MALTPDQKEKVARFRELIPETTLTDDELWVILSSAKSLNEAVAVRWRARAVETAGYVNIREGSSSRNLGDIHKNALEMAALFEDKALEETLVTGRSTTRAIVRPRR